MTPTTQLEPELPELLPCAFCGSSASFHHNGYAVWVVCQDCGASTSEGMTGDKESASAAWNRRSPAIAADRNKREGGGRCPDGKNCSTGCAKGCARIPTSDYDPHAPVSAWLSDDDLALLARCVDELREHGSDILASEAQKMLGRVLVAQSRALSARLLPEGYVAVPMEPTPEMVEAAFVCIVEDQDLQRQKSRRKAMADNYRKMIAAAPTEVQDKPMQEG